MSTGFHCHVESIASVPTWAQWLHVVTEVRHHHVAVPLETTTRKDDSLSGADAGACVFVLNDDTDGRTSLIGDEIFGWRRQPNVNTAVKESLKKCSDQSSTLRANVLCFTAREFCFDLGSTWHEVFSKRCGGAERHQCSALDDLVLPLRQAFTHGIGVRFNRATGAREMTFPTPRCVVIGERLNVERGRCVFDEILEHFRCGVDEDLEQLRVGSATVAHSLDVGKRSFFRIRNAGFGHDMVVWKPDASARNSRCAAEEFVFFDNENIRSLVCGHRRSYESGAAGANDDDINDSIPIGR